MPHERKSTMMLHGASVAMAPARSLTSHARRLYVHRYHGQHRFARAVFAFDVFLLGVAATLLVVNAAFLFHSFASSDGGLAVSFRAPTIRAAEEIPITVAVRSRDGQVHEDVHLQWRVPDWVEIVRAEPLVSADGKLFIGRITPGIEYTSLLVVRVRALPGISVPFEFELEQTDRWGFHQQTTGLETRSVASSAMSVEMLAPITSVAPGASLPIRVTNATQSAIPSASLRITEGPGTIGGEASMYLGTLPPSSTRIVFLDLAQEMEGTVRVAWQLEDAARVIAVSSATFGVSAKDTALFSVLPSRQTPTGSDFLIPSEIDGMYVSVFQHDDDATISQLLPAEKDKSILIHLSAMDVASSTQWSVIGLTKVADGLRASPRVTLAFAHALQFSTEARYFSAAGDQIGVGPLPPVAGQSTRYWIVWSVDPTSSGLEEIVLHGELPADVRATGQFASTQVGEFEVNDQTVSWVVPSLAPSNGQGPATFAFELEIIPSKSTETYNLMGSSTIQAKDAKNGAMLSGISKGDDSRWTHDPRAAKGY